MLYRKMRHLGYNFALIEECRVSFLMRKMVAQRHSNFAFNLKKYILLEYVNLCSWDVHHILRVILT